MREILFRVWCNNREAMFYEPGYMQISSDKDFTVYFDDTQEWESNGGEGGADLILMQYIGLLDKNGVKIFEGDIYSISDGDRYVVRFEAGSFTGSCLTNKHSHINGYSGKGAPLGWDNEQEDEVWVNEQCEVIGNTTDNPELLQ